MNKEFALAGRFIFEEQCNRIGLTFPAANVRIKLLALRFQTRRFDDHLAAKTEQALNHPTPEEHVLTGIRHQDTRHRTVAADIGIPRQALRVRVGQAAFLLIAAPVKIGVIVFTFLAKSCAHALIIQYNTQGIIHNA
jgi:hypothetical protein